MGIKVELDERLEKEFRQLAMRKYGYSKGSIKKATETAIREWTETESGARPRRVSEATQKNKTAVDLLTGLLKNTKHKTSVEEQHEVQKLWIKVATERGRKK
jgi:hypothetical protein